MSDFSDFIGGSGGSATLETIILPKSQTWTPPLNGTGIIHVIGAGASGTGDASTNKSGGAGGYSRKAVTFATGTNWTIVIGAGGTSTAGSQGTWPGGNSTAADGSSSLTANGGQGYPNAPLGGTASGGDVNFTGGKGGANLVGGGGAVGVFANGSTSISLRGGSTTDANGGLDQFLPLGLGQLIGGRGGQDGTSDTKGGFLSGGGVTYVNNSGTLVHGGNGGIGGGGGQARNAANANFSIGGSGGDGLVIIQYLTVT